MKRIAIKYSKYLIIASLMFIFRGPLVEAGNAIKDVFNSKCAKCHGQDGIATKRGKNLGAKNFHDLEWQKSVTDNDILNTIMNGKRKMPSWKDRLNQNEINELVHYVRVLLPHGSRKKMPAKIQSTHYK